MDKNQLVELLTNLGTESVQSAISNYTHWCFIGACIWCFVGTVVLVGGIWLVVKMLKSDDREPGEIFFCSLFIVMALIVLGSNLPDIFQPKAAAIHQFIKDARGN